MSAYPITWRALDALMNGALLSTPVARAWLRKGLIPEPFTSRGALGPRLGGQWSLVAGPRTAEGYSFDYLAEAEFDFPFGTDPYEFQRYADSGAFGEVRLVANVLVAGEEGSALSVRIEDGDFVDAPPSCPLDSTGLHVTDWEDVMLPDSPTPADSVLVKGVVTNPSLGTGSASVGVLQMQWR